jgi:hypothetical protein
MWYVALGNACDVVYYVSSTSNTLATLVATAELYQELKNSSDMLPVILPRLPNSKSLKYHFDLRSILGLAFV